MSRWNLEVRGIGIGPGITALRLGHKGYHKFQASLGYIVSVQLGLTVRLSLKKPK